MKKIHLYLDSDIEIPHYASLHVNQINDLEDGSVESFYILDILDRCDKTNGDAIVKAISNKLIQGGNIMIQAPDIKQLVIAINFNKVNFDYGRGILYDSRIYMHKLNEIVSRLQSQGFECYIKKYINIFEYYLEFKKL